MHASTTHLPTHPFTHQGIIHLHLPPLCPPESEKGARIYSLRRVVATNTQYYAYGERIRQQAAVLYSLVLLIPGTAVESTMQRSEWQRCTDFNAFGYGARTLAK
jgi:hypothetical protein